ARWLIQFQGGDGSGEFFECDLGLELCQHIAQAVVDTETKGQMLASITSGDVEGFTIFEPPFVTVGRSHQQQQFCAFRDRHTADFGSFKCFATPSDNRARVSQDFVDGFGNLFGFFHDGVPLSRWSSNTRTALEINVVVVSWPAKSREYSNEAIS